MLISILLIETCWILCLRTCLCQTASLVWHLPTRGLDVHQSQHLALISASSSGSESAALLRWSNPFKSTSDIPSSGSFHPALFEASLSVFACGVFVCAAPPLPLHQAMMVKATATVTSGFNLTANLRHLSVTAQRVFLAVFLPSWWMISSVIGL